MTIQTQAQEICRFDGEMVTILLPSTTLSLTLDEAELLFCNLEVDLLHGQFNEMYGEKVSETVSVADAPILRDEAWRLYSNLETNVFPEENSDTEPDDWADDETSCMSQSHDWRTEGF